MSNSCIEDCPHICELRDFANPNDGSKPDEKREALEALKAAEKQSEDCDGPETGIITIVTPISLGGLLKYLRKHRLWRIKKLRITTCSLSRDSKAIET